MTIKYIKYLITLWFPLIKIESRKIWNGCRAVELTVIFPPFHHILSPSKFAERQFWIETAKRKMDDWKHRNSSQTICLHGAPKKRSSSKSKEA